MFSNPYSPYLFISALLSLIIATITWQRRSAPGAKPLFLLLITMCVWTGANGLVLESKDPKWQIFWFNALTLGAIMGTPAFWAFGVEFTNRGHWLTTRNILLISIIPIISVILGWTTEYHGLFYAVRDFMIKLPNGDWNFIPGPFYWVYISYSYIVAIYTIGIIARAFITAPPAYRGQAATILAGTLIPLIGNIVYTFFVGVGKGSMVDPTPLLFTIMGIFYAFGLFWFHLFDMTPVARHTLVENMQDGVIVVDTQNRIVDVNPSALRGLNWQQSSPVGRNVEELLDTWFEQFSNLPVHLYVQTEVRAANSPETYFDLRVEPIMDKKKILTGRLIVFRDITRQKMAEKALLGAHDRLRLHLKEIELLHEELREQALRDPLTGLFNRRYMEETLERELSRAARDDISIGVCMADIDQFKSFNDQHGHKAGDLVLKELANIFITYSRAGDVVCRYGGEEFLILLPGADLGVTARRAEDWRRAFEQLKIEFEGKTLSTTLSLGVAVFPHQGHTSDELLKLADDALYLSKHNGRNQVSVAKAWGRTP
ncbi:MAG: diguanylate cyclase [Chloroflexi bacterium]|nr:diguanylate cyclase [Chloroflexota bacterium]